jgi:hypothetical protein
MDAELESSMIPDSDSEAHAVNTAGEKERAEGSDWPAQWDSEAKAARARHHSDLYHGHPSPSPETPSRIWDRRSGPVVDGSGPMQDLPLGA